MCNISGYFGNSPNEHKLKILGLLGTERGTDSFGVSTNGDVYKDISQSGYYNPNYGDAQKFFQKYPFCYRNIKEDGFNVIIQHNRKKSSGSVKVDTAHPFVLPYVLSDDDDTEYEFTLVHNGTISNIYSLCRHFDDNYNSYASDTEALAHLILNKGAEEVLQWYEGTAALAFHYSDTPNLMYFWKGASMEEGWDYTKKKWASYGFQQERPLHYFYDGGGVYYASLSEHLRVIQEIQSIEKSDKEGEPDKYEYGQHYQIPDNTLLIFDKDHIKEQIKVERKEIPNNFTPTKSNAVKKYEGNFLQNGYFGSSGSSKYDSSNIKESNIAFMGGRIASYEGIKVPTYYSGGDHTNKVSFNGFKYSQICTKDGTSMNILAHGIYRLNMEGQVTSYGSLENYTELFFFYNGFLVKNRDFLLDAIKNNTSKPKLGYIHDEGYYIDENGQVFIGSFIQKNKVVKPIFSKAYVETNKDGFWKKMYSLQDVMKNGKLNQDQYACECFAGWFGLSTTIAHESTLFKYAIYEMEWESFDLDDFKGGEFTTTDNYKLHDKYLSWKIDFKAEQPVTKVRISEAVKKFNEQYKTNFNTKRACNTWFYYYQGRTSYEYNINWGIDESLLQSYIESDREDKEKEEETEYDALPFDNPDNTFLDGDMEEINRLEFKEAKKNFLADYETICELHEDTYNKYLQYEFNLENENETQQKWQNLLDAKHILSGEIILN